MVEFFKKSVKFQWFILIEFVGSQVVFYQEGRGQNQIVEQRFYNGDEVGYNDNYICQKGKVDKIVCIFLKECKVLVDVIVKVKVVVFFNDCINVIVL